MTVLWILLVWLLLAIPFGFVVGVGIRAGLAPAPLRPDAETATRVAQGAV